MHIYISGICGSGLSSVAHFALDCGYKISGSDNDTSPTNPNFASLSNRGVSITSQSQANIQNAHVENNIDWFLHTPSIKPGHVEYDFATTNNIKTSKQNELVLKILKEQGMQMIAIAGTHGKTTTTSMITWVMKQLKIPVSYIIGTNISFGNSGHFEKGSKYFIYEADEFDKKILELKPENTIFTSIDFDHPDSYRNEKDYFETFKYLANNSNNLFLYDEDFDKILPDKNNIYSFDKNQIPDFKIIGLAGNHNRENAYLSAKLLQNIFPKTELKILYEAISSFPGTSRRFEKLKNNLYSDYAHHPKEIAATLQMATEILPKKSKLIVLYQPHQNLRQHDLQIREGYKTCFDLADKIYWLPTFTTRENPNLKILTPNELVKDMTTKESIEIVEMDKSMEVKIKDHLAQGDFVIILGAGSVDSWVRSLHL